MNIFRSNMTEVTIQAKHNGKRISLLVNSQDRSCSALFNILESLDLARMLKYPSVAKVQNCQHFEEVEVCFDHNLQEVFLFSNGEPLRLCDGSIIAIVRNRQPALFLVITKDQQRAIAIMFDDPASVLAAIPKDKRVAQI
jgi:hypothetical protein